MQFKVLGPLRIFDDHGREVEIPGRIKTRLVCSFLLAEFTGSDAVRTELLADVAWGGGRAASMESRMARLRQELTHLRKLIAPAERFPHIQRGLGRMRLYPEDCVDAVDFRDGIERARELRALEDHDQERALLETLVGSWSDRPFVDIEHDHPAVDEIVALLHRDLEYAQERMLSLAGRPSASGHLSPRQDVKRDPSLPAVDAAHSKRGDVHLGFLDSSRVEFDRLVGRTDELDRLTEALETPGQNVVAILGMGGIGKSHLVEHWMAATAERGAWTETAVFGFTFSSTVDAATQGRPAGRGVEAEVARFFDHALRFVGESEPESLPSAERGRILAMHLREKRTVLILDALECVQVPVGRAGAAPRPEKSISDLLKTLSIENSGLCIVTSRVAVPEIAGFGSTRILRLGSLDEAQSVEILERSMGDAQPTSSKGHLALARRAQGHPLTLRILGNYVRITRGSDLPDAEQIDLTEADSIHGGVLSDVLDRYERWFGPSAERSIIRLMGLFTGTAQDADLRVVRRAVATELPGIQNGEWDVAVDNLRAHGLLSSAAPSSPRNLTAHSLIHQHMAMRLRTTQPQLWKKAHAALYHHYADRGEGTEDDSNNFHAILRALHHGAAAGLHSEVFEEIIWRQLSLGFDYQPGVYSISKKYTRLGPELNIEVLRHFFGDQWDSPQPSLTGLQRGRALNWAGIVLRLLGRVDDAIRAHTAGVEICANAMAGRGSEPRGPEDRDWWECAIANACYIGRLLVLRGDVREGAEHTARAVALSEHTLDHPIQKAALNVHGASLHWSGDLDGAESSYARASAIDLTGDSRLENVLLVQEFQKHELRIARGEYDRVIQDLEPLEQAATRGELPDPIPGLVLLLISSARIPRLAKGSGEELAEVAALADTAMDCFERFRLGDYEARAHMTRSRLHRMAGRLAEAHGHAAAAIDASIGDFGLLEPFCWIEQGRVFVAEEDLDAATEAGVRAEQCISVSHLPIHGLEIDLFRAELNWYRGDEAGALRLLSDVESRAKRMGYHGLEPSRVHRAAIDASQRRA